MTKENKQRLNDLYTAHTKRNYPNLPDYAIPIQKWPENGANALTKLVIKFIEYTGGQAERISNTGRYIDESKVVQDVVGFRKTIGTGKWIPGTGTNGTADISCIIQSESGSVIAWKIEIKYGKDRQSDVQKRYQSEVERAGGVYSLVRNFDAFIDLYDNLRQS